MTGRPAPMALAAAHDTRRHLIAVERFEYMPVGEGWAWLRLLANLPSHLPLPSAASLAVESAAGISQLEGTWRTMGRAAGPGRPGLLWRGEFTASLEAIRCPDARFELLVLEGLAPVSLPAPVVAEARSRAGGRHRRLGRIVPLVVVSSQAWFAAMALPSPANAAACSSGLPPSSSGVITARVHHRCPAHRPVTGAQPVASPSTTTTTTITTTTITTTKTPATQPTTATKVTPTTTTAKPTKVTSTTTTTKPLASGKPSAPVPVTAPPAPVTGAPPRGLCAPDARTHGGVRSAGDALTGPPGPLVSASKPDLKCTVTGTRRKSRRPRAHHRHHGRPLSAHPGPGQGHPSPAAPLTSGVSRTSSVATPAFAPTPADTRLLQAIAGLYTPQPGPPAFLIPIFKAAGRTYHIPWQVLAAINLIETDYGRDLSVSSAGAVGWMQFMPGTWRMYAVDASGTGQPDPYDPRDAIFAAARLLHDNGGAHDLRRAIFAYNHATWYVDAVLWRAAQITSGKLPLGPDLGPALPLDPRYLQELRRTGATGGYVNPLSMATDIVVERTDEGKDFSMAPGSPILAIGDSVITAINPNWFEGQPQIVGQFTAGPLVGQYWYLAEQIIPAVSVGQTVPAGGPIAIYAGSGTGIEYGFAANAQGETLAQATPGYSGDQSQAAIGPIGAGTEFTELLASLGALSSSALP